MSDSLTAGMEALRAGAFARAVPLLAEAARANPNDYRARMALGAALGELGRWDEAISALREAVGLAPGIAATHYNLGTALEKAGRPDEARQAYQFTLRVDPGHERAASALQRPMQAVVAAPAPPTPVRSAAPAPAPAAAPAGTTGASWPAHDEATEQPAPSYDELWAAATGGGTVAPPRAAAAPPAATPRDIPEAIPEAPEGTEAEEEEGTEDAARVRARALRDRIQRESPQKEEAPPLRDQILARVRPLIRPAIFTTIALVVCVLGYVVYYEAFGPGKVARETLASADKSVRDGYQQIQRGLEAPDASLLALYAPQRMDRPATDTEIKAKNARLAGMRLRCSIQVLRVALEQAGDEGGPAARAVATIAIQIKGIGVAPVMAQGEQIWERVQDRWLPDPAPKNWRVFGNAPVSM